MWIIIRAQKFGGQSDTMWHATQQFWWIAHDPKFRVWAVIPLMAAFGAFLFVLVSMSDELERTQSKRRGGQLVTAQVLGRTIRNMEKSEKHVTVGGIPVPVKAETTHILMVGSTGSGKSNAQAEIMSAAVRRGDRLVIIDPNGEALARHFKPGDRILNPFDRRGEGWQIANEFRNLGDYELAAKAMIPPSAGEDETWRAKARYLLADLFSAILLNGEEASASCLLRWVADAPRDELRNLLSGTSSAALLQPDAGRLLDSVRGVLSGYLRAHHRHPAGGFSIRDWLTSERGNLFITWHDDQIPAVAPLINCWIDILIASVLSAKDDVAPLWLFIDELGSLEQLSGLENALTKGRKHGLRIAACLQSTAQLTTLYGESGSTTLRSCFRTLLVLGGSATDPETAEAMSMGLGSEEMERLEVTVTRDGMRRSTSESKHLRTRRLVLPSQIQNLPVNDGFLKLPGALPVALITVRPPAGDTVARNYEVR